MIIGLGVDVCSIERMRRALERHGARFSSRICTDAEQEDLAGRSDKATAFAGRFAAKEAFAKAAFGARGVGWHEVEVRREPSGRPVLHFHGGAVTTLARLGADSAHVSISHDGGMAVAVVVLERIAAAVGEGGEG